MTTSRPLQYLGLLLLILASLAIILLPVSSRPQEKPFRIALKAPRPWLQMVDPKKKISEEANALLLKAFGEGEKLPGELVIATPRGMSAAQSTQATIEATAATRQEAEARAQKVLNALKPRFQGLTLDSEAMQEEINLLPREPLFALGKYAVYPPLQKDGRLMPAVKLGLDLQGGVNLVLQVRKALFSYTFDTKLPTTSEARYKFVSQVRDALRASGSALKLDEADVNLAPDSDNLLEIRTQAATREEFNKQKAAIAAALKNVQGAKFTPAREPQYFEPQKGEQSVFTSSDLLENMVEIVRSRVDKLGVSEPQIQSQAPDRIIVQLPGVQNPQQAVETIGKTAQMTIRLMPQNVQSVYGGKAGDEVQGFRDTATGRLLSPEEIKTKFPLIVDGADLKPNTRAAYTAGNQPAVFFELQPNAARKFGEETARNVGRTMPIFLDERCITAPNINEAITGGSGQISGSMTIEEAQSLAVLLNSGALPAPIDVVENRTVSATLGADSLIQSLRAGAIGLIAVLIFMILFYRLPGVLADCALIIYCVLNLAAFILIGGTLTLPGVAGFLLALAMSLDTNILIFERLKEELAIQPNFASALRAAFSRAWTAILDSHVTTLIAAMVLFFLGTGPVKGFALTLGIGVLLSLFSAISVTRLFLWSVSNIGENKRGLFLGGKLPEPAAST